MESMIYVVIKILKALKKSPQKQAYILLKLGFDGEKIAEAISKKENMEVKYKGNACFHLSIK